MLAHIVFFQLTDHSAQACQRLVDACHTHLQDHPGTVHFSAGTRAQQFQRDVNDRDYHVGLHLIFESEQAHDQYQASPRHLQFIAENKDNWARVRVFDTDV